MEGRAGSRWKRIWQRLSDRTKPPRRWWWPTSAYRGLPRDVLTEAYKQYAETTNRTMLALLAVGTFCLLTVISTPDKALLAAEGTVKVPFAEASISFLGFVIVAPLLLAVVSVYLHIFYGYWLDAEHEREEHNTRLPEVDKKPVERVPMLFALGDPVSRGLTSFIFYWLTPVVLAAITWKGAGVPSLAFPLPLVFCFVVAALIFLRIRRSPEPRRRFPTILRWLLLACVVVLLLYSLQGPGRLRRPLDLFRADLAGAYLVGQDLGGARLAQAKLGNASLKGANLQEADLLGANLQEADLSGANLQEARLREANLRGANLAGANLQRASLQGANFQKAVLRAAKLNGAESADVNFQGADLQWAELRAAKLPRGNLEGANLREAKLSAADLDEVNLREADLTKADLSEVSLRGADVRWANLQGADLRKANLEKAELEKTKLHQADLREVLNLTKDQVDAASTDDKTRLPEYLKTQQEKGR